MNPLRKQSLFQKNLQVENAKFKGKKKIDLTKGFIDCPKVYMKALVNIG